MASHSSTTRKGGLNFKFVVETIAELRKVIWLERREVVYLTGLVLIVVIVVGAFLGVIDFGFGKLINGIFLGR
jgi:preprotein translocase subunit SecE|tara:strand:+ start:416 stop:634 length:219 start_codon:yes stop_codon:yes gene_type:complete